MQTWQQLYSPLGSLGLSALAAVVPIVFFFLALAVFRLKGHVAGSITLALSILVAIFAFQMPVDMALAAAGALRAACPRVVAVVRPGDDALARQIAMYLCRELTDLSLPKIGAKFGGRDHSTVLHAVRKISEKIGVDRALYTQVTELTNQIKQS